MNNYRISTLLVLISTLTACGSSPPVRFYTLEPIPGVTSTTNVENTIGVGPLRFPEYLSRPQIVSTGTGGEVEVAEFDRWAGSAEAAFQRTFALNLNTLLDNVMVIQYPFGGGLVSPDYRIIAQIARFGTDAAGTATLDVSWGMVDAEGAQYIAARRSVYTAPSESGVSYPARVTAMNETLRAFSRELAEVFRSVGTEN
jgi:uncharacterized lipoprotein YmbA